MSEPDPIILVRESPKAIEAGLRFASRPIVGQRELLNSWRDQHNKSLTAAALKRDGKVACKPLTKELYAEYAAYRKRIGTSWQPLPPHSYALDGCDAVVRAQPWLRWLSQVADHAS